mmetsp:Transcript_28962/g.34161  ORF Transcript_28962/g.34161 Transcript_28962/m.34161 type:complete len:475 (+) Transcript_28962:83-1507(+)|eukprot:CAMPEP_0114332266 /NCGR_PEP_ID=MMETSP0101-20121206/2966_1 /TAXON_ID=38822 ORGANISM="Pteridomonas danica, Strain PT" /NCGR_SAMPLE_ID=MMETSP0101 /ASSEMBLY_ACC=CAM_ASM_000211 /LENGTH=474 /DNA_ID=CAMNT_0001462879 /DNA_START=103 /DNA_END=1527 /DNA_ORIENTATION=+
MSTPEEASEYLSRTNFKSLIEWVTAEVILNRPDDPVGFCRNLLDMKIEARGSTPFAPEQATEYVRACYAEASNLADEHGVIHGKVVNKVAAAAASGQNNATAARLSIMERIVIASRSIADSLDPYDATNTIIKEACGILNADRASIFIISDDGSFLSLMIAEGAKEITVPMGSGIAGGVASSGKTVNIPDCYADSRFDPSFDSQTGYKTKNMVCSPIKDTTGTVVGVLQIINKAEGPFDKGDEEVLDLLTAQAGIALRNARMFRAQATVQRKLRSVTDLVRSMQAVDMGVNSLIFTMTSKAPAIVEADRCTIFLVDERANAIWSQQGEINVRIDLDKPGIAATVVKTGNGINIPDAYADSRFNQEVDRTSGYKTNSILCLPIKGAGKTVGVIQLINKAEGPFNDDDEEMMSTFLDLAGPILSASNLVAKRSSTSSSADGNELGKSEGAPRISPRLSAPTMGGFAEDEDEEEEEE